MVLVHCEDRHQVTSTVESIVQANESEEGKTGALPSLKCFKLEGCFFVHSNTYAYPSKDLIVTATEKNLQSTLNSSFVLNVKDPTKVA